MPGNSPIYGLPYLVGSDGGKRIKEVSEALALKLEAVLAQNGNPPLDSDLTSLLQRLGALENEVDQLLAGAATPWETISLSGGWSNFGAPFRPAARRFINGIVQFRGAIKGGGLGASNPILTLPSGQRPIGGDEQMLAAANGGFGDLRIDTAGRVYIHAYTANGNNAVVSLNGIMSTTA